MSTRPIGTSVVRAINARAAFRLLLDRGPLSRPEIATALAVSKPTASHLLAQLREIGLIKSIGNRDGGIGRAAELFSVDGGVAHAAAVDVTPERIAAVVVDLTGARIGEYVLPTPDQEASDPGTQVLAVLQGACEGTDVEPAGLQRVVVGIQGAIDPTCDRLRFAAHLPGWQDAALTSTLQEAVGTTVDIENDVNLVTIAEHARGAAVDRDSFAELWVSDGIGLGLMFGGRMLRGRTGGAGEISDLPLPGAPVPPDENEHGASGMQALAGAPALGRVLAERGFDGATPADAMRAAASSDSPDAEAALDEVARRLALGLSAVVAIIDPDVFVLAGDISVAGGERLRSLVERHLHSTVVARPPVLLSELVDEPVLAGAAHMALTAVQDDLLRTITGGQRIAPAAEPASD